MSDMDIKDYVSIAVQAGIGQPFDWRNKTWLNYRGTMIDPDDLERFAKALLSTKQAEPSGGDVPGFVLVPKELQGEMLFEMRRAIATSINHEHETLKYVWRRTLDAAPKVSARGG